jgi:hypothetical protein
MRVSAFGYHCGCCICFCYFIMFLFGSHLVDIQDSCRRGCIYATDVIKILQSHHTLSTKLPYKLASQSASNELKFSKHTKQAFSFTYLVTLNSFTIGSAGMWRELPRLRLCDVHVGAIDHLTHRHEHPLSRCVSF